MAYVNKAMFRATLGSSNATLYTVPAGTTAVVTNVVFANKTASAVSATIALDGVTLFPAVSIPANTTVSFDMRQALAAGKTITGFASAGSSIDCHVSGTEVS